MNYVYKKLNVHMRRREKELAYYLFYTLVSLCRLSFREIVSYLKTVPAVKPF